MSTLRIVAGLLLALVLGSGLIVLGGGEVATVYQALLWGAFGNQEGWDAVLIKACPIILTALAVALPLRLGLFNLGGEGQMAMGGLFATLAGLQMEGVHPVLAIGACTLAGALGGACWASIAAAMKVARGVNEVISTLLLNYVAATLLSWAVSGPLMAPGAPYPYSAELPDGTWLPSALPGWSAHAGIWLAIGLAVVFQWVYSQGSIGMSARIVSLSPQAARYAGLSPARQTLATFGVAGACAGLTGAFEVLGVKYQLFQGFMGSFGYDGVIAAMLGAAQPAAAALAGIFLAGLKVGANAMQRATGLPVSLVEALQGLIILCITVSAALPTIRFTWARMGARQTKKGLA
ncbi:ABC transporter permease [Verminephrobacter aporrectodeae]|uniref:ABC transporter permease n=1 Tax=Verminephrobacter aporrectodeae TaxID=1110389 RepID=UPI002238F63C|nr:ABC transporter permease [Verminephrobacter aporrectodeae]MCW5222964.1 ABC transporter permease [Verminephrobacter aporrectodeae subsp. tuberculatae]MCW5257534.1 ABC transporter permease [Verminephrobacter aporrectodeae subsp. tuberculatae]MCW5288428.1 ABC transporter permease [Verminephrobacter aporrectodeae subsp. tuberculatae]MCW8174471.1 ABC transporter permease [Verminephrobacter aporrectodeae subsp. tuberculatae]MCW8201810.1 ABC transporter permease [Verminephrobacter aporrectodeae su